MIVVQLVTHLKRLAHCDLEKTYLQNLILFEYSFIFLLAKPANTFNKSQETDQRNIILVIQIMKIAPTYSLDVYIPLGF